MSNIYMNTKLMLAMTDGNEEHAIRALIEDSITFGDQRADMRAILTAAAQCEMALLCECIVLTGRMGHDAASYILRGGIDKNNIKICNLAFKVLKDMIPDEDEYMTAVNHLINEYLPTAPVDILDAIIQMQPALSEYAELTSVMIARANRIDLIMFAMEHERTYIDTKSAINFMLNNAAHCTNTANIRR